MKAHPPPTKRENIAKRETITRRRTTINFNKRRTIIKKYPDSTKGKVSEMLAKSSHASRSIDENVENFNYRNVHITLRPELPINAKKKDGTLRTDLYEGNLDFYTEEALEERENHTSNMELINALKQFWDIKDLEKSECGTKMTKESYFQIYLRISMIYCLDIKTEKERAKRAEIDWIRDVGYQRTDIEFPEFCNALYEFCDIWTDSVDEEKYTSTMKQTFTNIAKQNNEMDFVLIKDGIFKDIQPEKVMPDISIDKIIDDKWQQDAPVPCPYGSECALFRQEILNKDLSFHVALETVGDQIQTNNEIDKDFSVEEGSTKEKNETVEVRKNKKLSPRKTKVSKIKSSQKKNHWTVFQHLCPLGKDCIHKQNKAHQDFFYHKPKAKESYTQWSEKHLYQLVGKIYSAKLLTDLKRKNQNQRQKDREQELDDRGFKKSKTSSFFPIYTVKDRLDYFVLEYFLILNGNKRGVQKSVSQFIFSLGQLIKKEGIASHPRLYVFMMLANLNGATNLRHYFYDPMMYTKYLVPLFELYFAKDELLKNTFSAKNQKKNAHASAFYLYAKNSLKWLIRNDYNFVDLHTKWNNAKNKKNEIDFDIAIQLLYPLWEKNESYRSRFTYAQALMAIQKFMCKMTKLRKKRAKERKEKILAEAKLEELEALRLEHEFKTKKFSREKYQNAARKIKLAALLSSEEPIFPEDDSETEEEKAERRRREKERKFEMERIYYLKQEELSFWKGENYLHAQYWP